jgi:diguanylate cyclase (GGDEF)-like protein/PAS domain S-box-containing protein
VHPETDQLFCRARILYMEDDVGLGRLLQKRLERMACMVDIARDGTEGLVMFANGIYDVVIADFNMPGVNGLEVLRKLKDAAPVIILTGQGDEKVAVEAMKTGAADYVTKDVNGEYMELLPSIIDRVMERQQLIRDARLAQSELQASEARYRAIVEDQTELICRFEYGGKLTFANAAFCRYFGIRQADIVFQSLVSILSRKAYQYVKEGLKTLTPQNPVATSTQNMKMADGKVHWLQWTSRAIFHDTYKLKEYQLVGRDITELKLVEAALREGEEKNSALLNAIPDPIMRMDRHGTCVDLRFKKGQSLNLSSDFVGKNIAEFFPPDVVTLMQNYLHKVFLEGNSQVFQFELRQGSDISYQEARLAFAGGNEALVIVRDITESTKLEQHLQHVSVHDALTGLYNRLYFVEEIRRLKSGRSNSVGIVMCDVDGLKMVNDNLGHSKGDELLKAAADVIAQAFRGSDAVARIGGDEFAVILPDTTQAVLEKACSRLRRIIAQYNEANPALFLSISVGAAVSSEENSDLGTVFHQADAAMYSDKTHSMTAVRQRLQMLIDDGKTRGCPK